MIRKKPTPHLMRGVKRFSEKIMPKQRIGRFPDSPSAKKLSKISWGEGFQNLT
jgi:hypothetical protein